MVGPDKSSGPASFCSNCAGWPLWPAAAIISFRVVAAGRSGNSGAPYPDLDLSMVSRPVGGLLCPSQREDLPSGGYTGLRSLMPAAPRPSIPSRTAPGTGTTFTLTSSKAGPNAPGVVERN